MRLFSQPSRQSWCSLERLCLISGFTARVVEIPSPQLTQSWLFKPAKLSIITRYVALIYGKVALVRDKRLFVWIHNSSIAVKQGRTRLPHCSLLCLPLLPSCPWGI